MFAQLGEVRQRILSCGRSSGRSMTIFSMITVGNDDITRALSDRIESIGIPKSGQI